jgi:tetratricopeptide (TPR) repeat protein
MGGAEETSREPIRTPEDDDMPVPQAKKEEQKPLYAEDVGTPVEEEPPEEQDEVDGVAEVDLPEEDTKPALDAPAEEEEGWGIQDWYDEQDEAMDNLEIDLMIRAARHRLRIDPDDPAALSILSYYQYLAEDFDGAVETYDRYIELYPEDAAGYNNKALIYKRRGEYGREEALYRVALAIEPNDVTALNNLGVNLAHQGRYDEALSVMRQLEILDPGDAYADLHRAKIYAEMGDDDKAFVYLEKALEGMKKLDTLHHIEFRQDIRVDPSFEKLRQTARFRGILFRYYGEDSPLQE